MDLVRRSWLGVLALCGTPALDRHRPARAALTFGSSIVFASTCYVRTGRHGNHITVGYGVFGGPQLGTRRRRYWMSNNCSIDGARGTPRGRVRGLEVERSPGNDMNNDSFRESARRRSTRTFAWPSPRRDLMRKRGGRRRTAEPERLRGYLDAQRGPTRAMSCGGGDPHGGVYPAARRLLGRGLFLPSWW